MSVATVSPRPNPVHEPPPEPTFICECGVNHVGERRREIFITSPRTGITIIIPDTWWPQLAIGTSAAAIDANAKGETTAGFTKTQLRVASELFTYLHTPSKLTGHIPIESGPPIMRKASRWGRHGGYSRSWGGGR